MASRVQVLIDGVDRGDVSVGGEDLMSYAGLVASFAQIISEVYDAENLNGDFLEIDTSARLKSRSGRRRSAYGT